MKRNVVVCAFVLIGSLLAGSGFAQDSKPVGDAASKAVTALGLKTDLSLDGAVDKINYIHYFVWLNIDGLGVAVAPLTDCTGTSWMTKKLEKRGAKAASAKDVTVQLELSLDVRYEPLKFSFDGKSKIVGHKWKGVVSGSVKDSAGKVVSKFALKHQWGANTQQARKTLKSQYMSEMTKWILIELYELPAFLELVPAGKRKGLPGLVAKLKAQKDKSYDEDWEFEGDGQK